MSSIDVTECEGHEKTAAHYCAAVSALNAGEPRFLREETVDQSMVMGVTGVITWPPATVKLISPLKG